MTDTDQRALLRSLPQVEELLSSPALERAVQRLSRRFVADCAREAVAQARADVLAGCADQVTSTPSPQTPPGARSPWRTRRCAGR